VVPLLDTEAHLTRDELERVARPVLDQTVQVTKGLLNWADLPPGRLAGVFLVGGASRIPLVATLLHRALGEAPVVIEQPELVVAEGSILADAALLAAGPSAPGPTAELKLVSSGRAEGRPSKAAAARAPAHIPGTTGLQPPVDPWPDADHGHWTPDPDATVPTPRTLASPGVPPKAQASATRPMSPAGRPLPRAKGNEQKTVKQPRPPKPKPVKRPRRSRRFLRFLQILLSIVVMIVVPVVALLLAYGWGNGEPIKDDAIDLVKDIADLLGI
jgi:cell division ATPase FtsA